MHALITTRHGSRETLLSLDLDERTKVTDLAERLSAEVGAPRGATMYVDGSPVSAGTVRVEDGSGSEALAAHSGIRDGAVVTFADPGPGAGASGGPVDLCVTGGTGTGAVVRLGVGESLLQVGPDGRLRVDEPREGGLAAVAIVVALDGGVRVRRLPDPRSAGRPVHVDRSEEPLGEDEAPWPAGTQLRIGPSVLTVQSATRPDADLRPAAEPGHLDYNRPPRLLPPMPATHFRLPAEPMAPARNPLPWLAMAMPAVLGIVMAMVFQSPYYLMFALASPLMGLGNWWMQKRNGVITHKERLKQHAEERAALEEEVLDAVRREQHRRRVSSPGAAELRLVATTPTRRLWERRSTDGDHLTVRLGLSDATSRVEVEDSAEPEHRRKTRATVRSVPVTVSLREAGVVGLAGPGDWPRRRARWMVGQLGVLQSPRDVQVYVLTSSEHVQDWAWAAWLPHVRPSFGQEAVALIGTTTETLSARVAEVNSLISQRRAAMEGNSGKIMAGAQVVVVLDGARRLRALPGVVSILRDGPGVGVSVVCLDGDEQLLPEECTVVALARVDGGMTLSRQDADDLRSVLVDEVLDDWYEPVARAVAAVHDVTASEGEGLIPDSARLVEVLGIEEVDAEDMVARWRMISNGGKGSTEAVVGVSLDGPFTLDMVRDGPHALVGGTTGSGKSEFLQTVVASLAVVNTPETMNFVLVDYKGGAAFSQCEQLPHTVGMVTDLDSHLVERALDSLRAELTFREHVLAAAGAKDLEDYLDAQGRGYVGPTLPRLLIVIDEFASMARELPDFVAGLVNIAQRGRSLGIHLILATQRPGGVVSPEIRANTNLRVALRMTDKSESKDVIDANDAADIAKSQPGRAYARLGSTSLVPFQSARVGGRRLSLSDVVELEPPFVARVATADLGAPPPRRPRTKRHENVETDLAALVETLRETARMGGWPAPRRPWLPALPDLLPFSDVVQPSAGSQFGWALEDSPSDQRQGPAVIDLDEFGHRYVVGAPGSGRSTVLRTTAFAAASKMPVSDLHLYAIDCGNGALTVLNELPHTGAVVLRGQTERTKRLLTRLKDELGRRQQVLADGNFASVTEQRELSEPGTALPRIMVLIDRWESFISTYGEVDSGALVEAVQELLRDGASAGIHLLVSGDRSLLSSRMSVLTDDSLVLRLTDRFDYGMVGIDHKKLPEEIQPGRGFRSGSALEVQVAILGSDPAGRAQTNAARQIAAEVRERETVLPGRGPFRVDDLPTTITVDAAYKYVGPEAAKPMWALLGVGGDDLSAFGMDLAGDAPAFIVAGPSRSGRSTMLAVMTESLLRGGTQVVLLAPRASVLRDFEGRAGVRAVLTGTEITEEDLAPHLDPDGSPVVLVVDDAELVTDAPAKTWLRAYLRTATDNQRGLIIGGDASEVASGFSGWQVDIKKSRRGALLSPQDRFDGDLVGASLSRSAVTTQVNPGKALVHLGTGELVTMLVPTL
ncbi:DNA segregation ATPase FtsK/SpoIIIE, S-DNA-T family [Promicromonospora umidemergens]|uniref:FtsK/SpoIIIE domain-containing protein n=1 Tax=Promicromonospora umidemergens TaxID=629679 RepID=A0ABP8XCX3_9MICO|nr:FtsK/SpoIIIE domain-containing protein [Promicromonospora umidemergens]MCP2281665.1 DNA segregation ATPase FtsK/SpoIIIE, S-DNA-T family [Promicromonospora umidemergens]